MVFMKKFISQEKLGKKAKRALNQSKRNTWGAINPATKKIENKKAYNRKKIQRIGYDDDPLNLFMHG